MRTKRIRSISTASACLQLILVGAIFALAMLWLGGCAEDETPIPQESPGEDLIPPEPATATYALADDGETEEDPPMESTVVATTDGGTPRIAFRYDRAAALRWIEKYARSPNAKFAYCGDWNWDADAGGLVKTGADCTNFASQVLWAGGLPLQYSDSEHYGWWYKGGCSSWGSSRSWRQVRMLMTYLVSEARVAEFKTRAEDLQVGDIIFYRLRTAQNGWRCENQDFNHTAVVSGRDGNGKPLVSYHSNEAHRVPWAAKNGSQAALGEACSVAFVHIR